MSLKKIFKLSRTVAFKLTLWYTTIFSVSTLLVFLFCYYLITSFLQNRIDEELIGNANSFYKVLRRQGINGVIHEALNETKWAGEKKVFFRIINRSGGVFYSSNMDSWKKIDINEQAISTLFSTHSEIFETLTPPDVSHKVRVLYAFIDSDKRYS